MVLKKELTNLSLDNLLNKSRIDQQNLRYGFKIGPLNLIYDVKTACELLKDIVIYRVPNTPKWMLGLINLRGNLVPVFNLEDYFGFESLENKHQLLLVLGEKEKAVAFQVKDYPELLNNLVVEEFIPKLTPKIENYILGAYRGKKVWLELDKEKLFSALGKEVCI